MSEFFVVPLDELKDMYSQWEYCRRSNDGTKAIIHKEILLRTLEERGVMMLPELDEETNEMIEPNYPYELKSGDEINEMEEFKSKEEEPIKKFEGF